MEVTSGQGSDVITRADVESTADSPAALTANLFFCRLCQSVYRQAKLLPCLHSFCRRCLVDLVVHGPEGSGIRCPTCQYLAPLPPSGVVGVPDNTFLNRLCQNYLSEIQSNLQGGQPEQQVSTLTSTATPSRADERRTNPRDSGEQTRDDGGRNNNDDDNEDDGEEDEENQNPKDPYASERVRAPAEGSDQGTLDAIHNKNRLQAKVMGLQGEALRLTYAIDHINGWPGEWQNKLEDLKRAVRARSSQMQFAVKRAERALLSRIEEGGRSSEHRFLRAAETGKQRLREGLRNVLHEVNVLKGVRELGTDAEINAMCAHLLGRSVGMTEVALEMPGVALEAEGQQGEEEMREIITRSFGKIVFTEEGTDVFKPEPVDFSNLPVEDFVSKASAEEEAFMSSSEAKLAANTTTISSSTITETTTTTTNESGEATTPEETVATTKEERRARRRSDKRRHVTDLGLDSPDVREYLAQFQTARESFRTRRREILQQGQLGRVSASSTSDLSTLEGGMGLDAVRARLRSSSRESAGRMSSLERGAPGLNPSAGGLISRRGSAPLQRSSSLNRGTMPGALAPPTAMASKFLSTSAGRKPPPSPVVEDLNASPSSQEGGLSPGLDQPFLSPQVQRRREAGITRSRRHSVDASPPLEQISASEAADLLTQNKATSSSGGDRPSTGDIYVSSRPIRRAISSGADKRAKIEILRETWQRRKEILIQNEGFVTADARQDSPTQIASPRQTESPPVSPRVRPRQLSESRAESGAESSNNQEKDSSGMGSSRLASRLADFNPLARASSLPHIAMTPAPSYPSIYDSHGGLPTHVLNTVKITIPEVNERTSPTPETMKNAQLSGGPSAGLTATLVKGETITMRADETAKLPHGEAPKPRNVAYKTTDEPSSSSSTSTATESSETQVVTSTRTATVEKNASLQPGNRPAAITETSQASSSVTQRQQLETQASSTATSAPSPPRFFFKSRLTGLPVGAPTTSTAPSTETNQTTTTTAAATTTTTPFFKSRLTGLPVGAPVTSVTSSTTAAETTTTTTTTPFFKSRLTGLPVRETQATTTSSNTSTTAASVNTQPQAPKTSGEIPAQRRTTLSLSAESTTTNDAESDDNVVTETYTIPITSQTAGQTIKLDLSSAPNSDRKSRDIYDRSSYTNRQTSEPVSTTVHHKEVGRYAATSSMNNATSNQKDHSRTTYTLTTEAESTSDATSSPGVITETFVLPAAKTSVTEDNRARTEPTPPATQSFFKSRLTGLPVGAPTASRATTATAATTAGNSAVSAATTTTTTTQPLLKSRLTGQPLGMQRLESSRPALSTTTTTATSSAPTPATSSRYPSRCSTDSRTTTDSRYKPSESVDVASLIAAMYGGHEKQIIFSSTTASTTTTSKETTTTANTGAAKTITTATSATTASTGVKETTTGKESTTGGSGIAGRELPPLRSAPAFSYTRRYNMLSTSSTSNAADTKQSDPSKMDTQGGRQTATQSSTSTSSSSHQSFAPYSTRTNAAETSSFLKSRTSPATTTATNKPFTGAGARSVTSETRTTTTNKTPDIFNYQGTTSSSTTTNVMTVGQNARSPVVNRRHTVEVGRTVISDAMTSQSEQRLDYPRSPLPDVIPDTTDLHQGSQAELHRRGRDTGLDTLTGTSSCTTTTTNVSSSGGSSSSSTVRSSELLRKAYGLDVDSEISRGITLTDAIRKSDPAYRHYTSSSSSVTRTIPEPLDLKGATAGSSEVKDAPSPGDAPTRSPAKSPSLSPAMSPTSPRGGADTTGIKGRLKDIARKKKERWRHLSIH